MSTRTTKGELSCQELMDFLADDLSGELSPEHAAAFDAHRAECSSCASYTRTYRAAIAVSKAAFDDHDALAHVPEELVQAILELHRQDP